MHKNTISKRLAALAAIGTMILATNARADLVIDTTTTPSYFIAGASNPSAADIVAAINAGGGGPITTATLGALLYKINSDGSEAGTLTASYSTAPAPWTASSTFPIVISFTGGTAAAATFLVVKDGNLGSYAFNIGPSGLNWNGTEDIDVYNLFGPDKTDPSGTSHIEFFGANGVTITPLSVPEPTTIMAGALLLLPFGAAAMRALRKKA